MISGPQSNATVRAGSKPACGWSKVTTPTAPTGSAHVDRDANVDPCRVPRFKVFGEEDLIG
jgi:hypothetical protein